jgi:hypothetical protein
MATLAAQPPRATARCSVSAGFLFKRSNAPMVARFSGRYFSCQGQPAGTRFSLRAVPVSFHVGKQRH